MIAVEEEDGDVLEIGKLIEGFFGMLDEGAGGSLEVELSGLTGSAADIDIGQSVPVDVPTAARGLRGKAFWAGCSRYRNRPNRLRGAGRRSSRRAAGSWSWGAPEQRMR